MKDARKLVDAGLYQQALSVLQQEKARRPDEPELDLLLGECYLGMGHDRSAEEAFGKAEFREPERYKAEVAKLYVAAVQRALDQNQEADFWDYRVSGYADAAVVRDPEVRVQIADMLLTSGGKRAQAGGQCGAVSNYFDKAVELHPESRTRAAEICAQVAQRWSQALKHDRAVEWARLAAKLDTKYEAVLQQYQEDWRSGMH